MAKLLYKFMKCARCNKEAQPNRTRCGDCAAKSNNKSLDRRKRLIAEGKCVRCRKPTENGKKQCESCCETQRNYRLLHKLDGMCSQCNRRSLPGLTKCEYHQRLHKESQEKFKDEVFAAYGGYVCSCCGETIKEFLTIDHVNGGGCDHRKEVGSGLYRWLRQNVFPEGFQVLCCNCNWGKKLCGVCPHQIKSP